MSDSSPRMPIVPSGFFALRTPVLPFDELLTWDNASQSAGSPRERNRRRLRDVVTSAPFREALFVASHELDAHVDSWLKAPLSQSGRKIERALLRYFIRMAARPTPFGLFAACSVGTIGHSTRLTVGSAARRHARLDMDYIVALTDALARDPNLQADLKFFPNSSLYRVAGRARYLEVRRNGKGCSHHRASLALPAYLETVLARASDGATLSELAAALLEHDREATRAEAAEYVGELIEQQVLVSELTPAVTGPEPVHRLIEQLRRMPVGAAAADVLTAVRDDLEALQSAPAPAAASPDPYRAIAARLSELPAGVDESRLFQVDLVRPSARATLGENVVAEILRGVELLRRLASRPLNDPLGEFRDAFTARFGDTPVTREVPLTEVLDDETGVGFGERGETVEASSLLEGLPPSPPPPRRVAWCERESYLLARLTEVLISGEQELTLSEHDIEQLAAADPLPIPDAFAVMARLEAASNEAVARGDFRILLASASGPSGARVLGRFCHADPELAACVEQHLRAEEAFRPGAVFAEIVHLPEGRTGNILARPTSHRFEIEYLGRSGAPAEMRLPVSDLRVSVNGGRVALRSARLGVEVIPRLTAAHNFAESHGVYGFLCALQSQGVSGGLAWDWGPLAASAFLPRVVCGRIVLARARWRVTASEAADLATGSDDECFAAVQRWRRERRLPRWICLTESDNELPIDLDNELMVDTLLAQIKGRDLLTLTELFPAPDRLCATGAAGRYIHELVVPFVTGPAGQSTSTATSSPSTSFTSTRACPRSFLPGSQWLSLKLYAGSVTIDHLVRDVIGPLAAELENENVIRQWFFVRYADPHLHLRVRFESDPGRLAVEVMPRVDAALSSLLNDGRIWRVQSDTYEREIERYGGPTGIDICEQLFHHDSEAVVQLVRLLENDSRGDARWRLALLGMDQLLNDLGLDMSAKRALLRRTRDGTGAQPARARQARPQSSAKYRAESTSIARILDTRSGDDDDDDDDDDDEGEGEGDEFVAAAREILQRRSQRNAPSAALLQSHADRGELSCSVADMALSLLHMHANRLLRSAHHAQETVLYDFLCRWYDGQAARNSAAVQVVKTV